jgi:tryptophan-rich sensory protein
MAKKGKSKAPSSRLFSFICLFETLGVIVTGIIINSDPTWYNTLTLPFFSAPSWFIAIVWLILYTLMGSALYMVHTHKGKKNLKPIYVLFVITAILPMLNAIFFWQLYHIRLSTLVTALLWLLSIGLTLNFWHASKKAGALMLPVLLWTMFSLVLSLSILSLNGLL